MLNKKQLEVIKDLQQIVLYVSSASTDKAWMLKELLEVFLRHLEIKYDFTHTHECGCVEIIYTDDGKQRVEELDCTRKHHRVMPCEFQM